MTSGVVLDGLAPLCDALVAADRLQLGSSAAMYFPVAGRISSWGVERREELCHHV
jgi:hypothetical protein